MYSQKLLILFTSLIILDCAIGMTRPQLKKTLSMMKKKCMQKFGATEDKVGKIEEGVFIPERSVMCYVTCIYQNVQVIKNNRLDMESVMKQVEILYPNDMKAAVKIAIKNCMNIQDGYDDMCEGVYHAVKCFYEQDPPNFVFP